MARPWIALPLFALILGCVAPEPDARLIGPPAEQDACGASALREWVGQPAAVTEGHPFTTTVRMLRPDTPRTEDYSPSRLNIEIDAAERITGVWCG